MHKRLIKVGIQFYFSLSAPPPKCQTLFAPTHTAFSTRSTLSWRFATIVRRPDRRVVRPSRRTVAASGRVVRRVNTCFVSYHAAVAVNRRVPQTIVVLYFFHSGVLSDRQQTVVFDYRRCQVHETVQVRIVTRVLGAGGAGRNRSVWTTYGTRFRRTSESINRQQVFINRSTVMPAVHAGRYVARARGTNTAMLFPALLSIYQTTVNW